MAILSHTLRRNYDTNGQRKHHSHQVDWRGTVRILFGSCVFTYGMIMIQKQTSQRVKQSQLGRSCSFSSRADPGIESESWEPGDPVVGLTFPNVPARAGVVPVRAEQCLTWGDYSWTKPGLPQITLATDQATINSPHWIPHGSVLLELGTTGDNMYHQLSSCIHSCISIRP